MAGLVAPSTYSPNIPHATLEYFVVLTLYDANAETDLTLRLGSCEFTDHRGGIDGTVATYHGRLSRGVFKVPHQKLYSSSWAAPTFTCQVTSDDIGDSYEFWDTYLDGDVVWTGADAKLYFYDLVEEVVLERIKDGAVTAGPSRVRRGSPFSLTITGGNPNLYLPATRWSFPSDSHTEFLQPRIQQQLTITTALGAADTQIPMHSAMTEIYWPENYVAIIGSEMILLNSGSTNSGAGSTCFAKTRGYCGTVATSHASSSPIMVHPNGPSSRVTPGAAVDSVLPFVFGQSTQYRGIYMPVFPCAYATPELAGDLLFYVSRGITGNAGAGFTSRDGEIGTYNSTNTWNDYSSAPNGDFLGWDGAPTSNVNPIPAGTYVIMSNGSGSVVDTPWDSDGDRAWVRARGILDGVGGNPHSTPSGIMYYLTQNAVWGAGLTTDPFYTGTIESGQANGDFADEYAEAFFDNVEGIVPEVGARAQPLMCDVLQDLCLLIGADLQYRDGLWYPKRREVTLTNNVIYEYDCVGGPPEMLFDPFDDYCNILTMQHEQTVLCEPIAGDDDLDPAAVPYSVTVRDDDAITQNRSVEVRKNLSTKWFRFYLSENWRQDYSTSEQTLHLEYLKAAAEDHLSYLSAPQVYCKSTLSQKWLTLFPGATFQLSIDGYTTRAGVVREIEVDCDSWTVTVLSWHPGFSSTNRLLK